MKDIMQEYGRGIISVMAAVIMMTLVFGSVQIGEARGLPDILAQEAAVEGRDFSACLDTDSSGTVMERTRPSLSLLTGEVNTGQAYAPEDLFVAEDIEGNPAKVKMAKILDGNMQEVEMEDGKVVFARQGVYRVWVKAIDSYNCVTENVFFLPVKGGS